jgi:hypothetical protein
VIAAAGFFQTLMLREAFPERRPGRSRQRVGAAWRWCGQWLIQRTSYPRSGPSWVSEPPPFCRICLQRLLSAPFRGLSHGQLS